MYSPYLSSNESLDLSKRGFQTTRRSTDSSISSNYLQSSTEKNREALCRDALAVFRLRKRLLEEIHKSESVIVIGEIGCGKTTLIPRLLLEDKMNGQGMIAVSQSCGTTTRSVARHVAQQMGPKVGTLVGYKVPFEDTTSQETRIKFLTDDVLLHEAVFDKMLLGYNIIILDEAHERNMSSDILLGIVRQARDERLEKKLQPLRGLDWD